MKDLLTTPFFPSSPRVARVSKRQTSDLLVQRRGAWRSLFCFFSTTNPFFLANHIVTRTLYFPKKSSFSPESQQRRRKDQNLSKENKILSPLSVFKRAGLLALFSSQERRYFFQLQKYLDPPPLPLFLYYTLNVLKTLNKKIQKRNVWYSPRERREKVVVVFCASLSR